MIRRLFRWLLGGRPMTLIEHRFTDRVSGKMVSLYRDGYGRVWLADSRWFGLRIPKDIQA